MKVGDRVRLVEPMTFASGLHLPAGTECKVWAVFPEVIGLEWRSEPSSPLSFSFAVAKRAPS